MALHKPEFWSNKKVLVTGHTGFKGSWLSLWLTQLGARVTGYALPPPTNPSLFELAHIAELVEHVEGDVRDIRQLTTVVARTRPDIIFHMAAQPLVRRSYAEPVDTIAINVMGTVNLLEAARLTGGVRAVICITSDKCYENREWSWGYRENEAMGGYDPYSASKGCSELVISAYRSSFFAREYIAHHGTALASVRAGNVIGGGDFAEDRLIPDIVRAICTGKRPLIRSPAAIRPWQHVLDPLSGYLMLAVSLCEDGAKFAEGWNFGPQDDDARPVEWITERLCTLWGDGASWERDTRPHPHEATYLKLDTSKARQFLGWSPTWRIDDALAEIMAFNRALLNKRNIRAVALSHIAEFTAGRTVGPS